MDELQSAPEISLVGISVLVWRICRPVFPFLIAGGWFLVMRWKLRDRVTDRLIREGAFRDWLDGIDYLLGIAAAFIITNWKLYSTETWNLRMSLSPLTVALLIVVTIAYLKLIKARVGRVEKTTVADLENRLLVYEKTSEWLIAVNQQFEQLISQKIWQYSTLLKQKVVRPADVISEEASDRQIRLIVQAVHELFSDYLQPDQKLRLGIYFRSESNPDDLERGYAWDGKTENCFSDKSTEYLKIVRTNGGVMSQLGRCYHSDEGVIIIADCKAAQNKGDFNFFYPEQAERIRSLLVYRANLIPREQFPPWLIYLDTDQQEFFQPSRKEEYLIFLERVTKRISLELVSRELSSKLPHITP